MFSLAKGRASYSLAVSWAPPYGLQPQTLPSGPVSLPTDILHSAARAWSSQLLLRANKRLPTEPKVLPAGSSPTHPVFLPCLWPLPALSSSLTLPPDTLATFCSLSKKPPSRLAATGWPCSSRSHLRYLLLMTSHWPPSPDTPLLQPGLASPHVLMCSEVFLLIGLLVIVRLTQRNINSTSCCFHHYSRNHNFYGINLSIYQWVNKHEYIEPETNLYTSHVVSFHVTISGVPASLSRHHKLTTGSK